MSRWVIRFRYVAADDVVLAEFENVNVETAADVARWEREVDERLASFGRKLDLIINLDGLKIHPRTSRDFGRARAQVLGKHAHASYRFGGDGPTRVSINTSSVLDQADANLYATYEEARAALLRDREAGGR